jgi:hypothetical protein
LQMRLSQQGTTEVALMKAMPESALPFAVHLLAYSPVFPSRLSGGDVDLSQSLKPLQQQLAGLLDALVHEDSTRPPSAPPLGTLAHLLHMLQV